MRRGQYVEAAAWVAVVILAFCVRVLPHYDKTFGSAGSVQFPGSDPWYFLRMMEYSVANFPRALDFDPLLAREGANVPVAQLYPLAAAAVAWVAGLGSPSTLLVESVAAWTPPVLGTLAVIVIGIAARLLWGRFAGGAAAVWAAVAPGEFMRRATLGQFDQHVAEMLFASLYIALIAPQLSRGLSRRLAIAAGFALAAFLLSWRSGVLMLFVFFVSACVVTLVDWLRDGRSNALKVFAASFVVALAAVLPFAPFWRVARESAIALAAACTVFAGALLLERLASTPWRRVAGLAAIGAMSAIGFWLAAPQYAQSVIANLNRLQPRANAVTVTEAVSLVAFRDPAMIVRQQFGFGGAFAIAGLVLLALHVIRNRRSDEFFVLLFSLASVALFFAQLRFAYYTGIAVALMIGLAASLLVAERRWAIARRVAIAVMFAGLALDASSAVSRPVSGSRPGPEWRSLLLWMRDNTPDPFASGSRPYTVATWWDHGYWVMRLAQRIPSSNPTQYGAGPTAELFLAQDETSARALASRLGATYLVTTPGVIATTKSGTGRAESLVAPMARWAKEPAANYIEMADVRTKRGDVRVLIFHPAYYRSLGVRLQSNGTAPVTSTDAWVATLERQGGKRPRILAMQHFGSAAAAEAYAAAGPSRSVVGLDPRRSCIDLPAIESLVARFDTGPAGPRLFEFR